MADHDETPPLTDSLEDYLETVYQLVRERKFARVKDIAHARHVRPGSVSPAMRRLAEMGLIEYVRREYIGLTPEGEERARRVLARHHLLCRLFEDILKMSSDAAEEEACAMEHSLSDEGMDRLVRFFEFLRICPDAQDILAKFHECTAITEGRGLCDTRCAATADRDRPPQEARRPLRALAPGQRGRVTHISGQGAVRQRLLDMGIMPDVVIDVDRVDTTTDEVWIRLQGFEIALTKHEAEAIFVEGP